LPNNDNRNIRKASSNCQYFAKPRQLLPLQNILWVGSLSSGSSIISSKNTPFFHVTLLFLCKTQTQGFLRRRFHLLPGSETNKKANF